MFKKVVLGAFGFVWIYRRQLFTALVFPFAFYVVVRLAQALLEGSGGGWILGLAEILAETLFAVTTHRMILLGPEAVPKWGILRWSKRETIFALHVFALQLLVILLAIPLAIGFSLVSEPGSIMVMPLGFVILVAAFWLIGRLSLVFPGIAIDKGVMFVESWRLTKSYQVLMFCVVLLFPALLLIPLFAVGAVPALLFNNVFLNAFIESFLMTFATVFIVAALSVAYQIVTREVYAQNQWVRLD